MSKDKLSHISFPPLSFNLHLICITYLWHCSDRPPTYHPMFPYGRRRPDANITTLGYISACPHLLWG